MLPVALAHLPLAQLLLVSRLDAGDNPALRRMAVSFVEVLQPRLPPAGAREASPPDPPPRPSPGAARPAAPAASAPPPADAKTAETPPPGAPSPKPSLPATSEPTLAEAPGASVPPSAPTSTPASAQTPAALPVAAAPASAASPGTTTVFEWPPSTRLSYTLTGWFRGPVEGHATVEWLQRDGRYQVHLEVSVNGAMSRRMSSEGEVTAQGLAPRRYQEETRIVLMPKRLLELRFEKDHVVMANGSTSPRPPGVQDSASQFVQMTWLFTMQPQLLRPGGSLQIPLALPRRVEPWTYELVAQETLSLPVGEIDTWHVKPRREPRPGGDLTAEFWAAPSLQNLPVRIVIRQDSETFVDLTLRQLPQQASR